MKLTRLFLPALALGGAALVVGPAPTSNGYSLIGDNLSLSQRDFRVYNNFSKAITNDNTTPDANFPGALGAELAIWKGCIEWGSELHGSGNGDPTQPAGLGSGRANFDPSWQGNASNVGSSSNNIHSQISGSSGGTLAYCETGFGGAWRIRYYQGWDWDDGPDALFFGVMDLQGVAAHEYGHALGLGHSSSTAATMYPSATGTGSAQRSIAVDDTNGVQAIYGVVSTTKPRISSINVSGNTLSITGEDFSNSNNQVWFTNANTTSTGSNPFVKVTGVSASGGGTQISVNIPGNAGPGDVLVQKNGSSHSSLSNAWPFDPAGNPPAPTLTGITPLTVPQINPTAPLIVLSGNNFETVTAVLFEGVSVDFTLGSSTSISFAMPTPSSLGSATIEVQTVAGDAQISIDVVANDPPGLVISEPALSIGTPAELTIGSLPGNVVFLAASPNQIPSVLPGIIESDIGAAFTTLTIVAAPVIDSSGKADVSVLTGGLPIFTSIYFQAAAFDGTFPLSVSEVASVFLF